MDLPPSSSVAQLRAERACFDGTLLAALAYGALLMLYMQLVQVLLIRPKRGRTFWAIVTYSAFMFPLATLDIAGMFKFSEMSYVDNRNYSGGPAAFYRDRSSEAVNVMGLVSGTILPWIGDLLMLYRLLVVWNCKCWVSVIPILVHLAKTAMSIPLLIAYIRPLDPKWKLVVDDYATAYYSLNVAFNIFVAFMICARFYMMRRKLETVMGGLHAAFYTSTVTMFVESGGFFTVWATAYLVLRSRGTVVREVFLLPYTHILSITRMLIILRMAENRAWSKDLVAATDRGVLDWQVSSTHSVPLHDIPGSSMTSFNNKTLPRKFQGDAAMM
ncbi:hypothetical protein BDZ94DRAFT_1156726 [Collybia nuda]|uniref:Uncharacterized protein n=1 Tax=Collybia nuda TaxID=64659 RepID=A0A9P5YGC3_9AGAR|nr:hypothetical protein BDZ94DRAFT_1156726 [Collybia nuda]